MTDDGPPTALDGRAVGASAEPRDDARPGAPGAATRRGPSPRRWLAFAGLAAVVVVVDQAAKALVTGALQPGQSVTVIGDLVRIVFGRNTGALFGLFKDNAAMFGLVSLLVIGLIVAYHARATATPYLTMTLGLLLGGAIGNMVDRLRLGFVVDFVDVGIGTTRFYTFNVADSAISLAILLLLVAALRPTLIDGSVDTPGTAPAVRATARASVSPPSAVRDDDFGDGLEPDDAPRAVDRSGDVPR